MHLIQRRSGFQGNLRVDLRGGLGNHLFQLAAAWSLRSPDEVRVVLNPAPGQATVDDLMPGLARHAGPFERLKVGDTTMIKRRPVRRSLTLVLRPVRQHHVSASIVQGEGCADAYAPRPVLPTPLRRLRGYFQDPSWFGPAESVFTSTIIDHAPSAVRDRSDRLALQAISLRRGDYLLHGRELDGHYYLRALRYLDPKRPTVIASDDPAAASQFANDLADTGWNMVTPPTLHDDPTLNDFWLIAVADNVVMSNSTFCWWATRVGDDLRATESTRTVTFPQHWVEGHGHRLRRHHWTAVESDPTRGRTTTAPAPRDSSFRLPSSAR